MRKVIILCIAFILMLGQLEAKKKGNIKRKKPQTAFIVIDSKYSIKSRGIGPIGAMYEFEIRTMQENITIDSVWFGATPVPCDLYKDPGGFVIKQTSEKGIYYIKANKDLYSSFPQYFDSTEAFKNFKTKHSFEGIAMIMYLQNGKRNYISVADAKYYKVPLRQ